MSFDVEVAWSDAWLNNTIYPKIDRLTESAHTIRLETKMYPGVPSSSDMRHVVSIPYTSMLWWKESDRR